MSAIRYCVESLYGCGNVEVTLLLQRKRREGNSWGGFKVWEKRMRDKNWRIFRVQNKGDKEEDGEKEEAEGEMLIEALQKDGDIIDSR
jgi:hypothetical protein